MTSDNTYVDNGFSAQAGDVNYSASQRQAANRSKYGTAPLGNNGRVPLASLGSGTATASTYLRGDGAWAVPSGGGGGGGADAEALHRPVATDPIVSRTLANLQQFIDWLSMDSRARGYIGEVSWPREDEPDADLWKNNGEQWFRLADMAKLWSTQWATGGMFGPNYNLSAYGNASQDDAASQRHAGVADVLEAHPTFGRVLRGVNVSGLEWTVDLSDVDSINNSGFSNANPGTYADTLSYNSEPVGTFEYLYSQGVRLVRIPFRWERVQPTLGGDLDDTQWGYVTAQVAAARSAGLYVVLDVHNYGGYWLDNEGTPVRNTICLPDSLVQTDVTVTHFADLWTKISNEYKSDPGVFYDLMNEPSGITPSPGQATLITSIGDFEDGTDQGWGAFGSQTLEVISGAAHSGSHGLEVTHPGSVNFATLAKGLSGTAYPGATKAALWVLHGADSVDVSCEITIQFSRDGERVSGLQQVIPKLTWCLIEAPIPPSLQGATVQQVEISLSGLPTGVETKIDIDNICFATGPTGGSEGKSWERITQRIVDTIRNNGDTSIIMIPLYDISNVARSMQNHPDGPWINDPLGIPGKVIYEGHHYFDGFMTGQYILPYDYESGQASAAGYGDSY